MGITFVRFVLNRSVLRVQNNNKINMHIIILSVVGFLPSFCSFGAKWATPDPGACPGFLRGGPISLGSLKKRSSDFKRGGGPMV